MAILIFLVLPTAEVLPVIFAFNLNDLESIIESLETFFEMAIDLLMFLHDCRCILLGYKWASLGHGLSHYLLACYLFI